MYLYYLLWQFAAYLKGKKLHGTSPFDIVHHATWGSIQLGSFLYKIKAPFIIGPLGGGQNSPVAFKRYFGPSWSSEVKRGKTSTLLVKYNPGCAPALRHAKAVLVSNKETWQLAKNTGAKNLYMVLDVAIPDHFFPLNFVPKVPIPGTLNLLWVGRFMPRKGLPLVLEVMKELKNHPTIKLTVVGDGEMKTAVMKMIEDFDLSATVNLVGRIPFEELKHFYAVNDVFFFTSLRDSGGSQLVEAMAYGMPIVTIDLHGQGMIVNDQTGIRCRCETPEMAIEELTKTLLDLYFHPAKVTEMSAAAFAFAREQTWEKKIKNVITNYYFG